MNPNPDTAPTPAEQVFANGGPEPQQPQPVPGAAATVPQILAVVGEKEISLTIVRGELQAKEAEIAAKDAAIASLKERIAELEKS